MNSVQTASYQTLWCVDSSLLESAYGKPCSTNAVNLATKVKPIESRAQVISKTKFTKMTLTNEIECFIDYVDTHKCRVGIGRRSNSIYVNIEYLVCV